MGQKRDGFTFKTSLGAANSMSNYTAKVQKKQCQAQGEVTIVWREWKKKKTKQNMAITWVALYEVLKRIWLYEQNHCLLRPLGESRPIIYQMEGIQINFFFYWKKCGILPMASTAFLFSSVFLGSKVRITFWTIVEKRITGKIKTIFHY